MKAIVILFLLATGASAGNLFEIVSVSKVAVPESQEVTYVVEDHNEVIHIKRPPLVTNEDVGEVTETHDPKNVQVKLSADGTKKFADKTSSMTGERIAIIIQGKIISAPIINKSPLGGNIEITLKNANEAKLFVDTFKKSRG